MNGSSGNWVHQLRRLAAAAAEPEARCELCDEPLAQAHAHVVERATQRLLCACTACALLFTQRADQAYRAVPVDEAPLDAVAIEEAAWDALQTPVDLAFFVRNSADGRVHARYPGAGGAIESALALEAWAALESAHPQLSDIEPDVEALLVHGTAGARIGHRLAVDRCYALVGRLRRRWDGISGGAGVQAEIGAFLGELNGAEARSCRA